jgi:hypothetical protein
LRLDLAAPLLNTLVVYISDSEPRHRAVVVDAASGVAQQPTSLVRVRATQQPTHGRPWAMAQEKTSGYVRTYVRQMDGRVPTARAALFGNGLMDQSGASGLGRAAVG